MREHPEQFCRGGVGRERETADGLEFVCAGFLFEICDDGLRARVGPDDGVVEGFTGLVVPDYGCFALVGDPDALDAVAGVAGVFEVADCFFDAGFYGGDEFEGVVLVPALCLDKYKEGKVLLPWIYLPWLGIDLGEFHLVRSHGFSISIEDEEASAGCALVDRPDKGL